MTKPAHHTYTSLDSEGVAAVGRVAIWAAWLERALADLASCLIDGVNGTGPIVTNDLMASRLVDLSRKLLKNEYTAIPQALQEKTSGALTRASAALQQRNQILHGTVGGTFIPGSTAFHSRKLPDSPSIHNAAELDAMGARLHASMEEIYDCYGDIFLHMRSR